MLSDLVPITYTTRNWGLGAGIREFKDQHGTSSQHRLAERLGAVLSAFLEQQVGRVFRWADPLIVPVPSSAPVVLAALERATAEGWWTPLLALDAASARSDAPRQRDRESRKRATVVGKWEVDENRVLGRHVMILDDMTTTGGTLHSFARALKASGAEAVKGVVLARNVGVDDEEWMHGLLDDAVNRGRVWTPHEAKMDIIR